jgi:hypothetical protein
MKNQFKIEANRREFLAGLTGTALLTNLSGTRAFPQTSDGVLNIGGSNPQAVSARVLRGLQPCQTLEFHQPCFPEGHHAKRRLRWLRVVALILPAYGSTRTLSNCVWSHSEPNPNMPRVCAMLSTCANALPSSRAVTVAPRNSSSRRCHFAVLNAA